MISIREVNIAFVVSHSFMACLEVEALTLLEENLVIETFLLLILW